MFSCFLCLFLPVISPRFCIFYVINFVISYEIILSLQFHWNVAHTVWEIPSQLASLFVKTFCKCFETYTCNYVLGRNCTIHREHYISFMILHLQGCRKIYCFIYHYVFATYDPFAKVALVEFDFLSRALLTRVFFCCHFGEWGFIGNWFYVSKLSKVNKTMSSVF